MSANEAQKLKYRIGGMDCASCVSKIETAVRRLPGVEEVGVSLSSGTLTVLTGSDFSRGAVEKQIKALGYAIVPLYGKPVPGHRDTGHDHAGHDHAGHDHSGHAHDHGDHSEGQREHDHFDLGDGPWWKTRKAILTGVTGAALALTYVAHYAFPSVPNWIFVPALLVGLLPIIRRKAKR